MWAERVMGIEPMLSAWKAEVLPLNYTRFQKTEDSESPLKPLSSTLLLGGMEGVGFEPTKA